MLKWIVLGVVLLVGVGLVAFEPWRAFTHSTVDEPIPVSGPVSTQDAAPEAPEVTEVADASTPPSSSVPRSSPKPDPKPTPKPEPQIVELGSGEFVDGEHDTSGTAKILQLADGSRFVRLEGFSTSDGPDVFVGLSDAPSGGAWGSYDDGRYVQLGGLKATDGNQNYEIPADLDLGDLTTVVIWCDRFNVAFGSADVAA